MKFMGNLDFNKAMMIFIFKRFFFVFRVNLRKQSRADNRENCLRSAKHVFCGRLTSRHKIQKCAHEIHETEWLIESNNLVNFSSGVSAQNNSLMHFQCPQQ